MMVEILIVSVNKEVYICDHVKPTQFFGGIKNRVDLILIGYYFRSSSIYILPWAQPCHYQRQTHKILCHKYRTCQQKLVCWINWLPSLQKGCQELKIISIVVYVKLMACSFSNRHFYGLAIQGVFELLWVKM
jgi:hypothetical protein